MTDESKPIFQLTESENEELMREFYDEQEKEYVKAKKEKRSWRKKLKGLINVSGLFTELEELDFWHPVGIVEIHEENKTDKSKHYAQIKNANEHKRYTKQSCEIRGVDHYFVWQTVGYLGDDYSGYCLYPLKDGTYFKIAFSC